MPAFPQASVVPFLFLLVWVLFVFSPLVADPDLWGHVRFGQDTLLTGRVVRADTYSYLTTGQPWINHEWLTEVIDALAYKAAGPVGLAALNLLLVLTIVGLLYGWLVRAGMGPTDALLLTAGLCLVLRPAVLNVRPQVFTYLLFLVLLIQLETYCRHEMSPIRRKRGVNLLFVASVWSLIAIWTNLHGGVLAGLAVLCLYALPYLGEEALRGGSLRVLGQPQNETLILALLLAPTALLVNPYGPRLITFLLRTATVARPEILEWQGVRLGNVWTWYWLGTVALTLTAVVVSRRPRRLASLVTLAVVALLPLSAVRHIPLVAIAAPVLAADHFADLWDRLARRIDLPGFRNSADLGHVRAKDLSDLANLTGLVLSALLLALSAPHLGKILIDPLSVPFPARAVALLQAAGARGNMATEFNWGEYVIWHLGPEVQVSVDGRRETVYPPAIYRENLDFMLGQGQWDRLVDRPETDLALVDRGRPVYALMRNKPGWVLAYEDEASALFVRSGVKMQLRPESIPAAWPADGKGLSFPVE